MHDGKPVCFQGLVTRLIIVKRISSLLVLGFSLDVLTMKNKEYHQPNPIANIICYLILNCWTWTV